MWRTTGADIPVPHPCRPGPLGHFEPAPLGKCEVSDVPVPVAVSFLSIQPLAGAIKFESSSSSNSGSFKATAGYVALRQKGVKYTLALCTSTDMNLFRGMYG
jgi:hypothetical protein